MYIDTHTHLSTSDYDDIDIVVKNAKDNFVGYLIVSCCTYNDILEGLSLVKKYGNIFLSIGLHPSEASCYTDEQLNNIVEFIKDESNKIVAVGEIGLDYHYGKDDINEQKELFIKQLKIAETMNLPVVIHTRDSTNDTISILRGHKLKGVIHCFSGSLETAREYIGLGYKLGIGGVVTFKNSKLPNVIKEIGLDNIVLETDSPYLAPEPYRGQKNESKHIPVIAKKIAEILEISTEIVENETTNNAITMFDLKV